MRILHIAAHLGGGVGKAHAAISRELPRGIRQTFLLLEEPIDRRHVDAVAHCGAQIVVERDPARIRALALRSDIVQLEYWGHPLLDNDTCRELASSVKTVLWSHVSGLFAPALPACLAIDRLVLTSEISLAVIPSALRNRTSVINSGFGIADLRSRPRPSQRKPTIAYLGTVDFKKMHCGIFEAIDAFDENMAPVSLWGHISPEVAIRAAAMRHPKRVTLRGHTLDPASALAEADIFFYPLRRDHYGTAENALVEAMSMGLVPVVLDNSAETKIVSHGKSGLVAHSIEECVSCLRRLVRIPSLRHEMGCSAKRAAQTKSPARSANAFVSLWAGLVAERAGVTQRQYA